MEKMMTWNRTELLAVVRWLEERHEFLHSEELTITAGDDFAYSNGKWPRVQQLQREAGAINVALSTAQDQLAELVIPAVDEDDAAT